MKSGWITNKGEILECEVYGHFQAGNDIIRDVWREYSDELDEISESCEALIEAGEHPEWHCYEMAQSDFEHKAITKLYKKGFLRLGNFGNQIAVSGYAQYLEQHKYTLKKLADKYECKLSIRKV